MARAWRPMLVASAALLCACGGEDANVEASEAGRVAPQFAVEAAWPNIPNDWVFGQVAGLARDSQDHIWVLQRPATVRPEDAARAAPPVMEYDENGNLVQSWGGPAEGYEWPNTEHGIFVDHNDFVWIAGSGQGDDQILKFTRQGEFVLQIGRAGQSGGNTDTLNLNRPADVYVHPRTNELFVADGYGNRRVIVFDAETGAYRRMWGAYGRPPTDPAPGESEAAAPAQDGYVTAGNQDLPYFNLVHGVRISHDDLVYVSDRGGRRVQVFTPDGQYLRQVFLGRTTPDSLQLEIRANDTAFGLPLPDLLRATAEQGHSAVRTAFSPDPEQRYLYIADRSNQRVMVYDRQTLEPLGGFGRHGNGPGEFYILHDMVVDSKGNLYTAEVNDGMRAQKWTFQGFGPAEPS